MQAGVRPHSKQVLQSQVWLRVMQAKRDAARAQEEAAQLKHQLQERAPLQALPNDPFNMGAWLSKKFERTRSGRSSGSNARSPHDASASAAVRL